MPFGSTWHEIVPCTRKDAEPDCDLQGLDLKRNSRFRRTFTLAVLSGEGLFSIGLRTALLSGSFRNVNHAIRRRAAWTFEACSNALAHYRTSLSFLRDHLPRTSLLTRRYLHSREYSGRLARSLSQSWSTIGNSHGPLSNG